MVDATRKYKLILAICITLALPFMVLTAVFSQRANRLGVLYTCASLLGLLAVPVLPVALDMSAEITYPIPAGLTSTILWFCSQVRATADSHPCPLCHCRGTVLHRIRGMGCVVWSGRQAYAPSAGMQATALVLVILIDGPLAVDEDGGPDSLQVGTWLLVGCIAAATFLSWLWSGRYAPSLLGTACAG